MLVESSDSLKIIPMLKLKAIPWFKLGFLDIDNT